MDDEEIKRQAQEDKQAAYERLRAAGIEPTEERLHDMMYESMMRRFPAWIKDILATNTTQDETEEQ